MHRLILILLLAAAAASAREPINGILGWEGTVRLSAQASGVHNTPGLKEEWTINSEGEMKIRVEWDRRSAQYYGRTVSGRAKVVQRVVRTSGSPQRTETSTWTGDAGLEPVGGQARAYAILPEEDGFYLMNLGPMIPILADRPGNPMRMEFPWDAGEVSIHKNVTPPNATRLQGSFEAKGNAYFLLSGNEEPKFNWKVTYDLQPIGQEELEVVVSPEPLITFRPEARLDGGRANTVVLVAKLRDKRTGTAPQTKARLFKWAFTTVSREPGIAMNYPLKDPGTDPDFRFEERVGHPFTITQGDGLAGETAPGTYVESDVMIGSYDWGGWGQVTVKAVLQDGREITGYLEGDADQREIRIPKRALNDKIAGIWRKEKGVTVADSADNDNDPVGDGTRGDGLTLWEEYRGFIENALHIEGDPHKKDYFIENIAGSGYIAGILKFQQATRLAVHYEFKPGIETENDRWINRNYSAGPHVVKQHNVVILDVAGQTGYAYAESVDYNPGPPGRIKAIWVPVFPAGGKASEQRYLQSALMHELLHACNIYHHGDEDVTEVVWQKLPGTEIILETDLDGGHSRQVDVYDEDGTYLNRDRPLLNRPLPDGRLIVAIGERNGTHSGPDHCAMRYDSARAYRVPGQPTKRYRVLEEPVGLELCGSAAGSGVNNAARTPQSRYGDAQPGRGNCAGQLMVNDGGPVIVR